MINVYECNVCISKAHVLQNIIKCYIYFISENEISNFGFPSSILEHEVRVRITLQIAKWLNQTLQGLWSIISKGCEAELAMVELAIQLFSISLECLRNNV